MAHLKHVWMMIMIMTMMMMISLGSHDRLGSIPAKPGGYRTQFVSAELSECSGLKHLWNGSIYRIIVDRHPNHWAMQTQLTVIHTSQLLTHMVDIQRQQLTNQRCIICHRYTHHRQRTIHSCIIHIFIVYTCIIGTYIDIWSTNTCIKGTAKIHHMYICILYICSIGTCIIDTCIRYTCIIDIQ